MRRTAAELRRNPGPKPPLGEFVWKLTREVRLPSPLAAVSGRYRDDGVHCVRGKATYYRDYVIPADPRTERQLDQRSGFGTSQSSWKDVPAAARDAWTEYGREYFAHENSSSPGPNLFTKVQSCRRGWGEGMTSAAPTLPPPAAPLRLEEVPAPEGGLVAFRLEHTLGETSGYRIELRMTAAMINGRKPQEPQFARAGETAPESFFPLAESGAVYLLQRPRHTVAAGERFGLGARLITPEGVPGPELRVDLIRQEADESAGSLGTPGSSLASNPAGTRIPASARSLEVREPAGPTARLDPGVPGAPVGFRSSNVGRFFPGTAGVPPASAPAGAARPISQHLDAASPSPSAGRMPVLPIRAPWSLG